jgi:diguanylate cyclase (GGDEF)-like protein
MELLRRRDAQVAVVACAAAIALTAVPSTRVVVVLAAGAVAVVATLALWVGGMIVAGLGSASVVTAGALTQSGALVAVALIGVLFVRRCSAAGPSRRPLTRGESVGRRVDQYVVVLVVGLGLAQVVGTALTLESRVADWAVVIAPVDTVLACLVLRFAASRQRMHPSTVLALAAALVTALYDTLATTDGVRSLPPEHALNVLWTAAACLFAWAALHPSMRDVFHPSDLAVQRTESARLLGLAPLALVPAALYVIGGMGLGSRLPTPVYLGVAALISLLAFTRGAQAVLSSERRAEQDPLTGLANRRGLGRAFAGLLAEPGNGVLGRVCLVDLDDFKHVNDTFGHETGDRLLAAIGERLRAAVGPYGTVARSGGDEFVLLLGRRAPTPDVIVPDVFGRPFELETPLVWRPHTMRASAGWTSLHRESRLSDALADADIALYAVKGGGKGTVAAFHPGMRDDVLGRLSLIEDLRRLLGGETDAGRLELRFQPLVRLDDGAVLGCEALVRWQHPDRGLVCPDDFLDLAEEHGLAARIDTWVLREALDQLVRWDALGLPPLFVSVNLGRSSMLDPQLDDGVLAALRRCGLRPDRLHLEITEHDELPAEAGVGPLHRLAARGVRVSLDDFGIGYTSLDYVRRYPVTTLKVDRALVECLQEEDTSALLRGVVLLAGCLGIEVLAEGIETPAQRERLTALGVGLGQGFCFARPLSADDVPDRVDRRRTRAVAALPAG